MKKFYKPNNDVSCLLWRRKGRCKMKRFLAIAALVIPFALAGQTEDSGDKPNRQIRVKVLPNPALVAPGGSIHFEAKVVDSLGNSLDAKIEWKVAPEKLGKIGPNGLFLAANHEGKGIVRAIVKTNAGQAVGHALVRVKREGQHQGMLVKVMPKRIFVKVGEDRQFKVKVFGPTGEPIEDAKLVFKVAPKDMGSITQDGLFTAGKERGKCRIIVLAKSGDLEGVGTALAIIGDPDRHLPVKIRPKHTALKPGGTQKFDYEILGPSDQTDQNAEPKVKWKVIPKEFGTITSDGAFTAGNKKGKGFVVVIVKVGDKVGIDRAVVIVGKPRRIRVKIYPRIAIVEPSRSFKFHALTFDEQGNPVQLPLKWLVKPKEAGTITPEGLFTAGGKPCKCEVIALVPPKFGIGKAIAKVIVQEKFAVKIMPKQALIEPKKSQKFNAQVFDHQGNPVNMPIKWLVRPMEAGTITPDGLFTAGDKPCKCGVIAFIPPHLGLGRDIAGVVIQRKLTVKIKPKQADVPVGKTHLFSAQAFDENGAVNVTFRWRVMPPRAGKINQDGLFKAGDKPCLCKVIVVVDPRVGLGRDVAGVKITR